MDNPSVERWVTGFGSLRHHLGVDVVVVNARGLAHRSCFLPLLSRYASEITVQTSRAGLSGATYAFGC